ITDVVVHAKLGATSSMAWVTSAASAQPIASAQVAVYDSSGAKKADAVTGPDGIAVLPGYDQLLHRAYPSDAPRALIAASNGADVGYAVSEGWDEFVPGDLGRDFDATRKKGIGLVFADRGIYRPGDVAHLHGIARAASGG